MSPAAAPTGATAARTVNNNNNNNNNNSCSNSSNSSTITILLDASDLGGGFIAAFAVGIGRPRLFFGVRVARGRQGRNSGRR